MPGKRRERLKISLVQKKPNKTYKVDVEYDYHIKELCKFLRENKDREVNVVINGKHTKFNSHAGKKRFATGYDQGSQFVLQYAKELFEETQAETKQLKADLAKYKREAEQESANAREACDRLRTNDTIKKLRQAAFADYKAELNEDRALLKSRLEVIEPVIKLIKEAKGDGDLQRAFRLSKKLKV